MNLNMEEQELLKKLRKSDTGAFEKIFRRYFAALHSYANSFTSNPQLSEDLVHDVFHKIWETRETLTIRTSVKSYLYRSVHNNCVQHLRHLKVEKDHSKKHEAKLQEALLINRLYFETGLSKLMEKEIVIKLKTAVSRMPEKTRDIFQMSRERYLKNPEIAQTLAVTEKAVEYHITRALIIIRQELKDYLPGFLMIAAAL